jgi:ketosteroid isomerase-like protein
MNLRKVLLLVGTMLLIVGGYLWWRGANPPLNDEQQIVARLQEVKQAVDQKNARGITSILTDDFRAGSLNKREIQSHLAGFFYSSEGAQVQFSNVSIEINSGKANVRGQYRFSSRNSRYMPPENRIGRFSSYWIKQEDEWKIASVEGVDNLSP